MCPSIRPRYKGGPKVAYGSERYNNECITQSTIGIKGFVLSRFIELPTFGHLGVPDCYGAPTPKLSIYA